MPTTIRFRARASLLAILTIAVSACTTTQDRKDTAPAAQSVTRQSCEVTLPAAWQQAFTDSAVDTGGSMQALTVGPAGEVAAVRDNGNTRELLLIAPDKSFTTAYAVPGPDLLGVGLVTMNDRWIVVGVDREVQLPGSNTMLDENGKVTEAPAPRPVIRIDVIDRRDNSVRTIADVGEVDFGRDGSGVKNIDSIALYGDTVYWITRDFYAEVDGVRRAYEGNDGIVRSHDLGDGAVAELGSGNVRGVRAAPVGIAWISLHSEPRDPRIEVRNLDPLPAPVAAEPGIDEDQATLVGDGTSYAWITGANAGGTGIARWSPDSGLQRVTTGPLSLGLPALQLPIKVDGPYVLIPLRPRGDDLVATIVDTRSGAVADLEMPPVAAGAGTIATQSRAPGDTDAPIIAGLIRTDTLPPLNC